MSTFLNQLPALLGVVVGAVGTILARGLTDRARFLRSQSVRWDARRLDAYADYARALKTLHGVAMRMTASQRPGSHSPPIDRDTGLAQLLEADTDRSVAWETVLLLGDEATVAAGREWKDAVRQVERIARAETLDGSSWAVAVKAADVARDRYYLTARRSLAVSGGDVSQADWLHHGGNPETGG